MKTKKGCPAWLVMVLFAMVMVTADASLTKNIDQARPRLQGQGTVSIYANLLGQFRTVFANLLWIKADNYHHEFMEHNPHWTKNTDLLPLMRLVTWMDPHFTQAYSSGAWMLGLYQNRMGQARSFLNEGIKFNPNSTELYETMAILEWRVDGNAKAALANLKKARDKAVERVERQRLTRSVSKLEGQLAGEMPILSLGTRRNHK